MSRLAQFAKEDSSKLKQTTLRVPKDIYSQFKEICDEINLTVNEGLVKLMELEIKDFNSSHRALDNEECLAGKSGVVSDDS